MRKYIIVTLGTMVVTTIEAILFNISNVVVTRPEDIIPMWIRLIVYITTGILASLLMDESNDTTED
jgi:hypothetical protein